MPQCAVPSKITSFPHRFFIAFLLLLSPALSLVPPMLAAPRVTRSGVVALTMSQSSPVLLCAIRGHRGQRCGRQGARRAFRGTSTDLGAGKGGGEGGGGKGRKKKKDKGKYAESILLPQVSVCIQTGVLLPPPLLSICIPTRVLLTRRITDRRRSLCERTRPCGSLSCRATGPPSRCLTKFLQGILQETARRRATSCCTTGRPTPTGTCTWVTS